MRALIFIGLTIAILVSVFIRFQGPEDVRDIVPPALFGDWRAESGPHSGSRLWITDSRVELFGPDDPDLSLESGELLAVHDVEPSDGFRKYRLVFGSAHQPSTLTVMLDASGRLRLGNRPQSDWVRAGSGSGGSVAGDSQRSE